MKRQAFTLVEMLVSLALVLFIMVILSQALSTGLETFRQLKATGELDEKLRMASTILRQDLQLDHFEGKRRLSDPSFWIQGAPREGFFHIEQLAKSVMEGRDGDNIPSWMATNHRLHFSIKARGSRREDFLTAMVPSDSPLLNPAVNTTFLPSLQYPPDTRYQDPFNPHKNTPSPYNSQWAEVAYFLLPNGSAAGGTPLFSLYRRERLAVPNNYDLNWGGKGIPAQNAGAYASMSCGVEPRGSTLYFNSPTDLTVPERRFGMSRVNSILVSNYTPLGTGEDLLLTDVISFTVRILSPDVLNQPPTPARPYDHVDDPADGPNTFVDLPIVPPPQPQLVPPGGRKGPPVPSMGGQVVVNGKPTIIPVIGAFDTWSSVQDENYDYYGTTVYYPVPAPLPIRLTALQITVRVYDLRTQQVRQITIIQDM
jgi:prepilin-type N-terminal cleavage/methylation domain-containing protein